MAMRNILGRTDFSEEEDGAPDAGEGIAPRAAGL